MNVVMDEDIESISNIECLREFKDKVIMVTGAGGLIGSMLIKGLLRYASKNVSQLKIVALVHSITKAEIIFADYLEDKNLEIIEHDVNEAITYGGHVDYIIHAASITSSKMFVNKPVETIKTAIDGSLNILEFAKTKGVDGIVYLSSLEVYGTFDNNNIKYLDEKDYGYIDILNVRSSYSESKRMAENIFVSYGKEYNIPVRIARLTQTFGAGVDYNDSRVFAEFARCVVEGKNIILHTKGETVRNYCYITDAVKAIFYIMLYGGNGNSYNVVNDDTTISIYDMAQLFCRYSNKNIKVEVRDDVDVLMGYNPVVKISLKNDKLKMLGWSSNWNMKSMIERFIGYMGIR
jgi:dTDP-glucose 4,6-dehydratase